MDTFVKHHLIVGDKVHNTFEYMMAELVDESLQKSANTQVSQFKILVKTFDSFNSYKTYSFSLNELEAEFSVETNELRSIVLRDTSVNKKITFSKDKSELTYVHGQDTLGQHSEVNSSVTREPIFWIKINDNTFNAPFDITGVYEDIIDESIGDMTEEDFEQEKVKVEVWEEFRQVLGEIKEDD